MRKRYTAEQREQLVAEVRATGASAGKVAKRMGVTPSSAYLWVKAATSEASAPVFARVVPAKPKPTTLTGQMVLEVGDVKLHVGADFNADLLRRVIAALSGAS